MPTPADKPDEHPAEVEEDEMDVDEDAMEVDGV
jgi:hypothetical protein